jgi:hypothetical protein
MKQLSVFVSLLIFLIALECKSQDKSVKDEYTFMFYNVENYFDSENDSLTNDNEFTFDGERHWSQRRLNDKTDRIAKVILAAGKWNPPVFVGLCEIENRSVLEFLTGNKTLSKFNYKIIQKDSPDQRGIDVAFLFRPDLFRPFDYQTIKVSDSLNPTFKTREILQVSGVLNNCDTIHVFVNHWPSRYGGMMETVRLRKLAAEALKKAVLSVRVKFPGAKIICTGDFNDTPADESLLKEFGAVHADHPDEPDEMVNLSAQWLSESIQTLKNGFTWQIFDQWIVSDSFLSATNCFKFVNAEIFKAPFLLEADSKFGGVKPRRTYVGFKYQEGFSDHLPVLIHFQLQNH